MLPGAPISLGIADAMKAKTIPEQGRTLNAAWLTDEPR